jgi:hypothetical protein
VVVTVSPPNAGLTRISARRSISSIRPSDAARSVNGSMSRQRQMQRRILGLRLDRRQRAEAVPQRMQVRRFQLSDEIGVLLSRKRRDWPSVSAGSAR